MKKSGQLVFRGNKTLHAEMSSCTQEILKDRFGHCTSSVTAYPGNCVHFGQSTEGHLVSGRDDAGPYPKKPELEGPHFPIHQKAGTGHMTRVQLETLNEASTQGDSGNY